MKERKYKEEYRLETRLNEKTGSPKQIPVYIGDYYTPAVEAQGRRGALRLCAWLAAYLLCYGAYLMGSSPSTTCIYVLPFACCATIPTLYAVIGAANTVRFAREMTRLERETGVGRLMRSYLGCAVLLALAAAGDLIFMIRRGFAGEAAAALLLTAAVAAAALGFLRARRAYRGMSVRPGEASKRAQSGKMNDDQAQAAKQAEEERA